MTNPPTCGVGLAETSPLQAKLGELVGAIADILDLHTKALDLSDERSRAERDAYRSLVRQHREAAEDLRAIAKTMAGYRDLPMGAHDMNRLASAENVRAFERFITLEDELITLLQQRVAEDRRLMAQ
jgi:hypothetical protein